MNRVRRKLVDPEAVLVTARRGDSTVGMAFAEPYRTAYGAGVVVPGHAHVSMVFVHPDHQRQGVGTELIRSLTHALPGTVLSLWTRDANVGGRALYAACGFTPTADVGRNPHGLTMTRWERPAPSGD